jgi:hypothetical protein
LKESADYADYADEKGESTQSADYIRRLRRLLRLKMTITSYQLLEGHGIENWPFDKLGLEMS